MLDPNAEPSPGEDIGALASDLLAVHSGMTLTQQYGEWRTIQTLSLAYEMPALDAASPPSEALTPPHSVLCPFVLRRSVFFALYDGSWVEHELAPGDDAELDADTPFHPWPHGSLFWNEKIGFNVVETAGHGDDFARSIVTAYKQAGGDALNAYADVLSGAQAYDPRTQGILRRMGETSVVAELSVIRIYRKQLAKQERQKDPAARS